MSEESIGSARLDIVVDTAQFDSAITTAKGRYGELSKAGQDAFAQLSAAQKRQANSLLDQINTMGKSRQEVLLYKAEIKGLPTAIVDDFRAKLAAVGQTTKDVGQDAKAMADAFKLNTFSDSALYKANQALSAYRKQAEEAQQAVGSISAPSLSDSAVYKANQALSAYRAGLEQAKAAQDALAASEAADAERIHAMVAASTERAAAEQAAIAASQRSATATDAEREAVERFKAASGDEAAARTQAQAAAAADERSRRAAATAAKAEADELALLLGKIDPVTAALTRLDQMEAQLNGHRAKGTIGQDDYDTYADKIKKARDELGNVRISAGQTSQALRQLPAQFTDIATSLAAGQPAWLVFLQQGGQIKDSFGGIGPAIRGVMAAVSPLTVGLIAGAGALALFGVAASDAYEDQQKLTQALAQSGNYAGVTSASFDQMASGITDANVRLSEAKDILAGLVGSGKIGSTALAAVGQAAADMAELTGKSADEASQAALSMFDGTAAGALKANEQYHFLTDATYEQIKALEEEGRSQDAVRVAAEAFHDAIEPRIKIMSEGVYGIAAGWKEVKAGFSDFYETFKTGAALISGTADIQTRIYALQGRKAIAQQGGLGGILNGITGNGFSKSDEAQLEALKAQLAKQNADAADAATRTALNTGAVQADASIDALLASVDKLEGKKKALADLTAQFEKLWAGADPENAKLTGVQRIVGLDGTASFSGGLYDKLKADIEKKYANQDTAKEAGANETAQTQAFKTALAARVDAYKNSQAELDAARKSGAANEADYYADSQNLLWQSEADQVAAINAEIARLQQRKVIGADRVKNESEIAQLIAQAQKVEDDAYSKSQQLGEKQQADTDKRRAAVEAYAAALDKSETALAAQVNAEIAKIGMGDREYAQQQKLNQIYQEQADKLADLAIQKQKGAGAGGISDDQYDSDVAALAASTDRKVKIVRDGYDQQTQAQGDWERGARSSYLNYLDNASNVAGQTSTLFTDAFDGMEGAIDRFERTGKLKFKSLVDSIIADLARMEAREATSTLLKYAGQALGLGGSAGVPDYDTGFTYSAKGNVFDSPDLSRYSSQIVNSPTMFAYAKGAGIMGEAGPEAIMPLTRTSGGKLGVVAAGGSTAPQVNIYQTNNAPVKVTNQVTQNSSGGFDLHQLVEPLEDILSQRVTNGQGSLLPSLANRMGTTTAGGL